MNFEYEFKALGISRYLVSGGVLVEKGVSKIGYLKEVVIEKIGRLRPIEESEKSGSEVKTETSKK